MLSQLFSSDVMILILRNALFKFYGNDIAFDQLTALWITIMLTAAISCFLVSEITCNYSQVDKLWSIMPVVYSLITLSSFPSLRILIMSILVTFWGCRLSFNFYRKGGYSIIPWRGEEDYRWKIIRQNPLFKGRIRFGLFNLFFISFYQHLLILLFSAPLIMAAMNINRELTLVDILAALLMILFLVIETIADNQQFRFQCLKRKQIASDGSFEVSLRKGFISEGLWWYVRHPNFVSEQAIWISFYLFGVAASGKWINWTLAGPVLLVLLFLGSTEFTERISSEKYPAYSAYKKEIPKFLPNLIRKKKFRVR